MQQPLQVVHAPCAPVVFRGLPALVPLFGFLLSRPALAADYWWSVSESKGYDDTVLEEFEEVEQDDELTYEMDASVEGSVVLLQPKAHRYCTTHALVRVDRTEQITRAPSDPTNLRKAGLGGLGLTLLGSAYVGYAARDGLDLQRSEEAVGAAMGGVSLVLGLGYLTPAVVALVRARDSSQYIGEVTLSQATSRDVCESTELAGSAIQLGSLSGTLDEGGAWSFDLAQVADLGELNRRAVVRVTSDNLPEPASFTLPRSVSARVETERSERAREAVLAEEIEGDACSEKHLRDMQAHVEFLDSQYDWGVLVGHEIFVLHGASEFTYTAGLPGTYRLWVFGVAPIELTVENRKGQSQPSDPGAFSIVQGELRGAKLLANTGEAFTVSIEGRGCTAMTVLMN